MNRRPPPRALLARLGWLAGSLLAAGLAVSGLFAALGLAEPRPAQAGAPERPAAQIGGRLALAVTVATSQLCRDSFQDAVKPVCNGQAVTYTIAVTNTGDASLTDVVVQDSLPVDALRKLALLEPIEAAGLGTFNCTPGCSPVQITQAIRSPIGDELVVTVTTQLRWAIGSLPAGQGQTIRFTGVVAGQADGTQITNRVTAISADRAAVQSTASVVRVLPLAVGQPSLAASPTWFSQDLGGTYSQDWADFNRSGVQALALGSSNGASVYRYRNGRLDRVAVENPSDPVTGQPIPAFGVAWADILNVAGETTPTLELVAVGHRDLITTTDSGGTEPLTSTGTSTLTLFATPATNYIFRYEPASDSFVVASTFTSTRQLVRVVAADLDYTTTPGKMDLVVSTNAIDTLCPVLLLRNTWTLTNPTPFRWDDQRCVSTRAAAALELGDVDGDQRPDLALGLFPNQVGIVLNRNNVFLNTDPLTPQVMVEAAISYLPYDFAFADYDRDGRLDLAAAYPLQREARLYRNLGGNPPRFELARTLRTDLFLTPLALGWGDFDGDGAPDLALTDQVPRIYFNQRAAFSDSLAVQGMPSLNQLWSLDVIRPLARAGLELALSNSDGPSMLFSAFTPHLSPTLSAVGQTPAASAAWGATGPVGLPDLVFGAAAPTLGEVGRTTLYRNQGDGTFNLAADLQDDGPVQATLADVTGDGRLDLGRGTVVENVVCQLQNQGLTVSPSDCWSTAEPPFVNHVLAWGDANMDGPLDLLVGSHGGPVLLYRNTGSGLAATPSFTLTRDLGAPSEVRAIAWADWEKSRYPGFAVAFNDGGVELYQNTRDGAFSLTQRLLISSPTSLAWANFNADPSGRPSLAVGTDGFGTQIFENTNGRLNASPVFTTQTLSRTTSVAWGDWDNDGDPDLAIGNAGDPVQVWDNQGSTPGVPRLAWAWSSQEVYSVTAVAWADATGDGFPELAVAQRGTGGRNGYYLNTTVVPTYVKTVYPSPAAAQQPFFVAVQRPGRTAPAGQGFAASEIIALPPTVTGVVPVTYSVFGPAGMALAASPRFEYSLDGGATWSTATPSVAPTVLAQAAPSGAQGFFYWDARKDLAISDEARFRIIAAPAAAPAEAMVGVSPPFRIRAVACQWPRDAVIRASTDNPPLGQAVFFTGTLSGGSGVITYTWDFGDGTPLVLGQAVQHAFTRNLDARVRLTVSGQTGAGCPENPYTAAVRVVRGGLGSNNPILFLPIVMRGGAGTTALAAPTAAPAAGQAERAADHGRRAPAAAPPALAGVEGIAGQRSFGFSCPSRDVGLTQQPTHTLLITDVTGTSLPPALSEDGLVVAFSSTGDPCGFNADRSIEVFLARREDGQVRMTQVTSSTGGILGGFNLGPTLNAAGTRLAFFSDRSLINENLRQSRLSFQIYAAEIDPATLDVLDLVRVTTDTRAANVLPAFDADGRYLAFISDSRVLDGDQTERPVPQVVRAELPYPGALGSAPITLQQITTHTTGAADLPAISPDGRSIAYLLDQKLYLWSEANPGAPVLLSSAQNLSGPSLSAPAEAPGTVRVTYQYTQSGQARVAYVAGTGQGPVELPAGEVGTPVPAGQPVIGDGGRRIGLLSTLNGQAVTVVYDVPTSRTITYTLPTPDPVTTAAFNRQGTRLAFVAGSDLYLAEYPFVTAFSVTQATKPLPAFTEDVISYTTTIVNPGPSTAEGVEIQIDLRGVGQTTPIAAVALQDNLAVSDTQRTFSGTVIEGGELGLATGAATGIFTSAVLAADYVVNWDTLAWEPERPLGKALPNYPVLTETGYLTGAAGMAGNTLLLHLDGTPAVSVNYQISGNYFYVYVQRHFLDHSAAGADPVCRENYIYNFSDGNSWAYNYCPTFESDGRFAKGIFFDGSLRLVEMPSGQPAGRAANGDNEPRSLEMWFRTTEGGALLSYQYNFCDAGGCFYDFLPTLYVGADGLLRGQLGFGCPYLTCTLPAGGQMITATTPVTDDQWHHLALVSTPDITIPVQTAPGVFADVRGSSVRLYLDGKLAGGGPVLGLVMAGPGAGNSVNSYLGYGFAEPRWPALAGAGRSGNGLYTGRLDELAFYARALDADEVSARYLRGAQRLRLQVRACEQTPCPADVPFVGPDGLPGSFFSEAANTTGVTPSLALDNRPIGRYFQYRAFLENNSALTGTIPMLRRVTVRSADIPEGFTASQGQCQSVLQENFPSTEAPDIYHQVLTCTLGTLPVGGSANVLAALQPTQWGPFTYTVALTPTGLLFNRANPDGAQSSYQTTLVRPVEALTITAVTITSPPVVEAGQPAVFTTTVSSNDTSPKVFYSWTVIAEQGVTAPTPAPTRTVSFNLVEPITVTPFASGVFTLTAVVSNSAGALTGTLPFTVAPAPMTVTSFHPPELVTGTLPTATFPFVITGTGFQENTKVEWNGDQLGGGELADNCPGPCTRITATISVSRTVLGVNTVVIRNGPGLDPATTVTLTHVVSTPVLSLALAGPDPLAADLVRPATTVVTATISRAQSQARTITLATTPAVQSFLALPATVNLPAGASAVTFTITGTLGGGPVTLVGQLPASIGAQTSNPVTVTVYNPQPQINTLTPTTATVGQAGLTLQIAGSNFVNGAAVFWDGVPLANPLVTGTTQLTADILANQLDISRTVNITVSNPAPNAGVSGSLPFRVISPTLQLNPASNSLNLGQTQPLTLVLVGNPQAQARTVTLATTPTVQSVVALPATVDLPAGASSVNFTITGTLAGAVEIYGVLPANLGAGPSNPAAVTVLNPQPQLSSLTPTTATVGQAGFTLQIAGSNFINGAAAFWNGTALGNPQVTGGTLLTADVLANQLTLSQTVNITVSNPSPSQAVSGSLSFRVISPTLQFSAPAASLGVGQELQLTATLWGNAQSQDRQVDFTQGGGLGLSAASATLLVATPTANLTVTGVTAGSTTVTATVSPLGLISTVNLTVQATTITLSVDSGSQTSLAVGSSAVLRATISHPQPQPRSLTITASTGGVVNIQSPVSLPASANFVTFSITATAAGNTNIQVQLPAEAGGDTDSLPVTTVP